MDVPPSNTRTKNAPKIKAKKKVDTRVDMLVAVNDVEYLCKKDEAVEDSTKIIEGTHFKIAKELKDILCSLFKRCSYDLPKMKKLASLRLTSFKLKAFFDVCDSKLGYVARLSRSPEFTIPSNISGINGLLSMLSMMLVFRKMIVANGEPVKEGPSKADVRNILKRPHTLKEEDEFVSTI